VLLAVCIEEPRHEDSFGGSVLLDSYGTIHWHNWFPTFYSRGPFLQLFRQFPEQGIAFILRLTNFATERWRESQYRHQREKGAAELTEESLSVILHLPSGPRRWFGDAHVYQWHIHGARDARVLSSALMALEKWLYELIDAEEDPTPWLQQIIDGSQSLAFAGLLSDVGKQQFSLFASVLRPLLATSIFYTWDLQFIIQNGVMYPGLIGWHDSSESFQKIVHDWYASDHRKLWLRRIAIGLIIQSPPLRPFFHEVVTRWREELAAHGNVLQLRMLIEHLTFENYKQTPADGGKILFEFVAPPDLEQTGDEHARETDVKVLANTFSMTCRRLLDGDGDGVLNPDDLESFWSNLQTISQLTEVDEHFPSQREDGVLGGIAVILWKHSEYLDEDTEKSDWCQEQLLQILENLPQPSPFDSAGLESKWQTFLAEIGVRLLIDDPSNKFARDLVANGITGYHYETLRRTVNLAFIHRDTLGSVFSSLENLVIHWSMVRLLRQRSEQLVSQRNSWMSFHGDESQVLPAAKDYAKQADKWRQAHIQLITDFVEDKVRVVSIERASSDARTALIELEQALIPRSQPEGSRTRRQSRPPRVHPSELYLDEHTLQAGFNWLDLSSANSLEERTNFLSRIRDLHKLCWSQIPSHTHDGTSELDELPSRFDNWIYMVTCRTIVQLDQGENPSFLWDPFLNLGTFAHHWVEHFCRQWFIDGIEAATSPEQFGTLWTSMIEYALVSDGWDPSQPNSFHLDDMVSELLGYNYGSETMAKSESYAPVLNSMRELMSRVVARWFVLPGVVSDFARNLVRPAYRHLLPYGIEWLNGPVKGLDAEEWEDGRLESYLLDVLRACFERHRDLLSNDELKRPFLELLTTLSSRGSHATTLFRDKVLDSLSH